MTHLHAEEETAIPGADRLHAIEARLDRLTAMVEALAEQQRKAEAERKELLADLIPIAKGMVDAGTERLSDLEGRGYLAFGRSALGLLDRVVQGYRPEDIDALGDSIVAILDTVRSLTTPEALALARETGEVLEEAEETPPVGIVGLVQASRDVNVQKGLGILVAGLRHVGRASRVLGKKTRTFQQEHPHREVLHREAPLAAQPEAAPVVPAFAEAGDLRFDAQGFLLDPKQWNEALGQAIAADLGIPALDEDRWRAIRAARKTWESSGSSPNIRALTGIAGMEVKDLYRLFPHAPAKTIARIAGIPKPAGCV